MTEAELTALLAEGIEALDVERRSRAHRFAYVDAMGRDPATLPERSFTLGFSALVEEYRQGCVLSCEHVLSVYYQAAEGVEARAAADARVIVRGLPALAGTHADLWDVRPQSSGVSETAGQIVATYSVVSQYVGEV